MSKVMATVSTEAIYSLEKAFSDAYANHYGQAPTQVQTLSDGRILINGIAFTRTEVVRMIQTLESETAKKRRSLVTRLISFFGGKSR
ncbi:MAG: hypothetical protein KJ064_19300 [Anaerolineae bacterium]|nr:hypothetical protein [Anaerolineae bacterium]